MTHREHLSLLVKDIGITEAEFCATFGLFKASLDSVSDKTILGILDIFNKLQGWFNSSLETWVWLTEEKINGFGGLTSSELITQHQIDGVDAVNLYIETKSFGGYE